MLEKELKCLWKSSADGFHVNVERLSDAYKLEKTLDRFDRTVYWRNIREYVAAASVLVVFGYYILYLPLPVLSKWGCAAAFPAAIYYCWKIGHTRKQKAKMCPELSLLEGLRAARRYWALEANNLKTIFTWALLPILPGMALFYTGMVLNGSNPTKILIKVAVSIVVGVAVWWVNQKAVKKKFEPLLSELDDQIKAWESEGKSKYP